MMPDLARKYSLSEAAKPYDIERRKKLCKLLDALKADGHRIELGNIHGYPMLMIVPEGDILW